MRDFYILIKNERTVDHRSVWGRDIYSEYDNGPYSLSQRLGVDWGSYTRSYCLKKLKRKL